MNKSCVQYSSLYHNYHRQDFSLATEMTLLYVDFSNFRPLRRKNNIPVKIAATTEPLKQLTGSLLDFANGQ